jgi:hypothetical protein
MSYFQPLRYLVVVVVVVAAAAAVNLFYSCEKLTTYG